MPALERFDECLKESRKAYNVMEDENVKDLQKLVLPPKTAMVFEIKHVN
jgi:hypothetical protein